MTTLRLQIGKHVAAGLAVLACLFLICLVGCWRDSPPDIQEFIPPAAPVEEAPPAETDDKPAAPAVEAPKVEETPEAKPQVVRAPTTAAAPEPEPAKDAPKAPTLIGTWRVTEVNQGGQAQPMPPGMEMNFTFSGDGTVSMSMSMQGQSHDKSGTYTLDGTQITMTQDGHAASGTVAFSGNDQLTLEIQEGGRTVRITMTRTS